MPEERKWVFCRHYVPNETFTALDHRSGRDFTLVEGQNYFCLGESEGFVYFVKDTKQRKFKVEDVDGKMELLE